jgi:hypothetical protein
LGKVGARTGASVGAVCGRTATIEIEAGGSVDTALGTGIGGSVDTAMGVAGIDAAGGAGTPPGPGLELPGVFFAFAMLGP